MNNGVLDRIEKTALQRLFPIGIQSAKINCIRINRVRIHGGRGLLPLEERGTFGKWSGRKYIDSRLQLGGKNEDGYSDALLGCGGSISSRHPWRGRFFCRGRRGGGREQDLSRVGIAHGEADSRKISGTGGSGSGETGDSI